MKEEVLYFSEVKFWKEFESFDPRFTFNFAKQTRMRKAASGFISENLSLQNHFVSFCLVSVNEKKGCEYYPDLFEIVIQILSTSTEFLNCLRVLKEESLKSLQGSNYEEHHDFRESGRI